MNEIWFKRLKQKRAVRIRVNILACFFFICAAIARSVASILSYQHLHYWLDAVTELDMNINVKVGKNVRPPSNLIGNHVFWTLIIINEENISTSLSRALLSVCRLRHSFKVKKMPLNLHSLVVGKPILLKERVNKP